MGRINTTHAMTALCVALGLVLAAPATQADPDPQPQPIAAKSAAKTLTLERIELPADAKTTSAVIEGYLGLKPGDPLDQARLRAGIDNLRASGLVESVDFYTKRGSERGALVLVLELRERGPGLRFGTGNSDLDGWYLIPAELSLDNLTGRGELAALQLRFGYRLTGLSAHYLRGRNPHEKNLWGVRAHALALNHVYFDEGLEYAQPTVRGGADFHYGRKLGHGLSWTVGLKAETVEVDSTGSVWQDDEFAGVSRDDDVPFEDLPAAIAAAVGRYERVAWRAELTLDRRSPRLRAGTPESGVWGRLRVESIRQKTIEEREGDRDERFGAASLDFRAYRPLGSGVLAWSARGAVIGSEAFFPDRNYLGGLYTVRGFPSASLSGPGGARGLWCSSLEYRAPLSGNSARPRVAGSLFVDVGGQGERGETAAVGAGWGLRIRAFDDWYLGADFAVPVSDSPVRESFHSHLSLGWRF